MWGKTNLDILNTWNTDYAWEGPSYKDTTKVTLPEATKTTAEKKAVEKNIKTKSIEQRKPLEAETLSNKLLSTAELDYKASLKIVAKKIWAKPVYDQDFKNKLEKWQRKNWLTDDGILWVITLSTILAPKALYNWLDEFIKLSTNTDIINFNKAINSGEKMNDKDLQKYEKILTWKLDWVLEKIKNKKLLWKANKFVTENYTFLQMSYLMMKFDEKNKGNEYYKEHFDRFEKLEKKYKNNPTAKSVLKNPLWTIAPLLTISKEQAKSLNVKLNPNGTISSEQPKGNLLETIMDPNATWKEKLEAASGSALGWLFVIIAVWNKWWFKWILMWAWALIAGAADWITVKSLAWKLGVIFWNLLFKSILELLYVAYLSTFQSGLITSQLSVFI